MNSAYHSVISLYREVDSIYIYIFPLLEGIFDRMKSLQGCAVLRAFYAWKRAAYMATIDQMEIMSIESPLLPMSPARVFV